MDNKHLIYKLSESIKRTSKIDKDLFTKFGVKRGLRNEDHSGVLAGLTRVGDVVGYEKQEDGKLYAASIKDQSTCLSAFDKIYLTIPN